MKHSGLILVVIACLGLSFARVETAHGYTIAVGCDIFPGGAAYPDYNTKCNYSWAVGGDPLHYGGRWDAYLWRTDVWSIEDEIHRIAFTFLGSPAPTPPESVWIKCAVVGPYQITLNGYLLRYLYGGTWGSGQWTQVDNESDIDTAYVQDPVPCP